MSHDHSHDHGLAEMNRKRLAWAFGITATILIAEVVGALLTNSLAATDEPLVHLGYRKYRRDLLKMGVDLYELSPLRVKRSSRLGFFMPSLGGCIDICAKTPQCVDAVWNGNACYLKSTLGAYVSNPNLAGARLANVTVGGSSAPPPPASSSPSRHWR